MNIGETLTSLGFTEYATIAIFVLTLIQITPIKINPWTYIVRMLGRALNKEIMDFIKETEAKNARYRILRFDDELCHHTMHTEEHFTQIISDVDDYEKYCRNHPQFENNKAVAAISNIKDTYAKCKKENSFQ